MKGPRTIFIIIAILCAFLASINTPHVAQAQSSSAVVHAVLFYSPNCGHCHYVITETLPVLFDQYGDQLRMAGIDVSQPAGQALFMNALQLFGLDQGGVPFLVVGDTYLVGSVDIPEKFPGLIEYFLALGGVNWPEIPGLIDVMNGSQSSQDTQPSENPSLPTGTSDQMENAPVEMTESPESIIRADWLEASLGTRLAQDYAGNTLAIIVLVGMLISMSWGVRNFVLTQGRRMTGVVRWIYPVLCIVGLGIAGYLAFVETLQVQAVCGPIGDCNTVQQSEYARLFGFLPIGLLGVVGYVIMLLAWSIVQCTRTRLTDVACLMLLVLSTFGTIFSIYLTFLEPFIIGATCFWCLSSAILMTILFLLSVSPGKLAVKRLMERNHD